MSFNFENLTDDRFQRLCQSLLVSEFPNIQCFPLNQADGGRDAVWIPITDREDFYVFQVKFVERPGDVKDRKTWLRRIIQNEKPKVDKLLSAGAGHYFLLTNLPGTGHLEAGSIDYGSQLLSEELGIPGTIWWRDDLTARLDLNLHLKWRYIEGATGSDLLAYLMAHQDTEETSRRTNAVRAFIETQMHRDESIRFKQVDLNNDLYALFVDPPLEMNDSRRFIPQEFPIQGSHRKQRIGVAEALLDEYQEPNLCYLLEGGPGQGKSTVAQFICQQHRLLLLNRKLQHIPAPSSARLPLKVDLRDYATWLEKKNPFEPDMEINTQMSWSPSLESFLAAQISALSGNISFSVNDLTVIGKSSAILLVLDGLDEVADIGRRDEVVKRILDGSARLAANCPSIKVLVTSRPTALGSITPFPDDRWNFWKVGTLSKTNVLEYTKKWVSAKELDAGDSRDVISLIQEKREQSHIQELSRNPMQLAILLNLMYRKGSSLPDKRTALYDDYIEIFLDRESEKSKDIREKRGLFVDLHCYLATRIHIDAESGLHDGRISLHEFRSTVNSFLQHEREEGAFIERLESTTFERIGFIVSRIEGTVEFEVQPLREYFVARFLKDTAPSSSAGREQIGSIADRFDAIVGNPYWLNVTRFLAGSLDKGELPLLIERLRFLDKAPPYENSSFCRNMVCMFLRDYVFAQSRPTMLSAINFVLEEFNSLLAWTTGFGPDSPFEQPLRLPEGSGLAEVLNRCLEELDSVNSLSRARRLCHLLTILGASESARGLWEQRLQHMGVNSIWLSVACSLDFITPQNVLGVLQATDEHVSWSTERELLNGDIILATIANDNLSKRFAADWLAMDHYYAGEHLSWHVELPGLYSALSRLLILPDRSESRRRSVRQFLSRYYGSSTPDYGNLNADEIPVDHIYFRLYELWMSNKECFEFPVFKWIESIDVIKRLVEGAEEIVGRQVFLDKLAAISGALYNIETCPDGDWLSMSSVDQAVVAYAMRRSVRWWHDRCEDSQHLAGFLILLCLAYADDTVVVELADWLELQISRMSLFNKIAIAQILMYWPGRAPRTLRRGNSKRLADRIGDRIELCSFLACATADQISLSFLHKFYQSDLAKCPGMSGLALQRTYHLVQQGVISWPLAAEIIHDLYKSGHEDLGFYRFHDEVEISGEVAERILGAAAEFPDALVSKAQKQRNDTIAREVVPVQQFAEEQGWVHL